MMAGVAAGLGFCAKVSGASRAMTMVDEIFFMRVLEMNERRSVAEPFDISGPASVSDSEQQIPKANTCTWLMAQTLPPWRNYCIDVSAPGNSNCGTKTGCARFKR